MKSKRLSVASLVLAVIMIAAACRAPATPAPTPAPAPRVVTPAPATPVPPRVAKPAPATPRPAVKPKQEGELRAAVSSFMGEVLNPLQATLSAGNTLNTPMFDSLLGANPDGSIAPGIAESWELAGDGLSWTFKIRKGVKFHNGDDLTAEDVRFSLLAFARKWPGAPKAISSYATTMAKAVKDVEVVDRYTVRVHTNGVRPYFPYSVAPLMATEGSVLPKAYIEKVGWEHFSLNPVGSGPWKFVEMVPGSYIKYEAVADHWRATPAFKRLTVMVIPEETTRLAMLQTGQADIIAISAESKKTVEGAGHWVDRVPGAIQSGIHIYGTWYDEVANPATLDKKVRQALSLAINREEIIEFLLEGEGTPAMPWQVWPFTPDVDFDALPKVEYNPTKAKQLLTEAGYPQGFNIDIYSFTMPGAPWLPKLAETVAGYWDQHLGVKSKIVPMDFGAFKGFYRVQPTKMALRGNASVFRSPAKYIAPPGLRVYYAAKSPVHLLNMPELEEMITASEETADAAKRKDLITRAATLAYNQYVTFPVAYANVLFGVSNRIKSWQLISGWTYISLVYETVQKAE